jgi:hypothetical protein
MKTMITAMIKIRKTIDYLLNNSFLDYCIHWGKSAALFCKQGDVAGKHFVLVQFCASKLIAHHANTQVFVQAYNLSFLVLLLIEEDVQNLNNSKW